MIRITKPSQCPDVLTASGERKRTALCREYAAHTEAFTQGARTFSFDAGVYGHAAVKQALIAAQHGKCCFCERKIGADGDVEHFRPKAAVRQDSQSPLRKPGYYWLAYEWDNLLLSCSACNSRNKRNLFPLANPDSRAVSHNDSVNLEEPLFIHPAQADPERYISFRKEIAYAIKGSKFARATISALGLNREILNEVRRDRLNHLITLRQVLDNRARLETSSEGRNLIVRAETCLADAVSDAAEFAGMARAAAKLDFRISLP